MKAEEIKIEKRALDEVKAANPGSTHHAVANMYPNFLGGTLVAVDFTMPGGGKATNHVHIVDGKFVVYRVFHDVCNAVSDYRERRWFFRLLEFAGVGGVIALFLIVVFSILLSVIALWGVKADQTVVEIVKLSFTTVLGYFFGSQASKR